MSKLIDADKLREFVDKRENYTVTSEALAEEINNYLDEAPDPSPIEYSEEFAENIRILLQDKLSGHSEDGSISWATLIDDKTLKDIVTGIWFYVGKEALKYPKEELNVTEWSEEDEKGFGNALWAIQQASIVAKDENDMGNLWYAEKWLKSLRPQSQWKPSEEQMDALKFSLGNGGKYNKEALTNLYDNLKKL